MTDQNEKKSCFVIAPIGPEGSDIRERSDKVLKYVIKPVAEACGYEAVRADKIGQPGLITTQIIQHVINDDLVIADLTGHNPNVFYELAVRHAAKKPIVQLIQTGESIPFDLSDMRTVELDHTDLDSVAQCKEALIEQINNVTSEPDKLTTPISFAINFELMAGSGNPADEMNAEIISMLQDIKAQISKLQFSVAKDTDKSDFLRGDRKMTSTSHITASALAQEYRDLQAMVERMARERIAIDAVFKSSQRKSPKDKESSD